MDYNVVVTNLDRRTDRWEICHKTLLFQGVPQERIKRFSNHDARNYSTLEEAQDDARKQYWGSLPRILRPVPSDEAIGHYCWRWSYFDVLVSIANQANNELTLVLVDDWQMRYTYDEICEQLERLSDHYGSVNIIQYLPNRENLTNIVPEVPKLRFGLNGQGDPAMLFSPEGARQFLDVANNEDKYNDDMQIPSVREDRKIDTFQRQAGRGHISAYVYLYTVLGGQKGCYSVARADGVQHLVVPDDYNFSQDRLEGSPVRKRRKVLGTHLVDDNVLGHVPVSRKLEAPHPKYKLGFRPYPGGYLQLTQFVNREVLFRQQSYRSLLLSDEHTEFRMEYARRIYEKLNARKPNSICEVACKDGYMLNRYASDDCTVVGVEPATNLHQYIDNRVRVYGDFMDFGVGKKICREHGKFDLIHAHNVIDRVPQPLNLAKGILKLMSESSVLILEFEYLVDLFKTSQFYHFDHEHYHYFSVTGIIEMLKRSTMTQQLHVLTAAHVEEQGGSIICAVSRNEDLVNTAEIDDWFRREHEYLSNPDLFKNFMQETERRLQSLVHYVNSQPQKSIQGLFVNAKAVVILNLAVERGLQLDRLTNFYDDTEELWGHCVPGTEIEICSLSAIDKEANRNTILFAPNLEKLAARKLPDMKITNVKDLFDVIQ